MEIGKFIKEQRLLLGLKGTELADMAGISSKALWHIEEGNTKKPKQDHLILIAVALGFGPLLKALGIKVTRRATLTETYIIV